MCISSRDVTAYCILQIRNARANARRKRKRGTRERKEKGREGIVAMVKEKKKENSRLVAKESSESDRYESCIVERSTTKSRHVRHGAWKMLGKGKGGIPTSSRSISYHGPHRRSPSFSSAVVSFRKDTTKDSRRRAPGSVAGPRSLARWRLILKPFICPRTFRAPPTT